MNAKPDLSLYLVTDPSLASPGLLEQVVEQAVIGGVTVVQLREKDTGTRMFIERAQRLLGILRPLEIPLIINDRVDVALAVGAEGVHLGQNDMPVKTARRLLGKGRIIGLSVERADHINPEAEKYADYYGVSPVFATSTKEDTAEPWGLEGLALAREKTSLPLVAIGGLHKGNAAAVIRAGADSIAVVSAICAADNPRAEAERLRAIIAEALSKR